jgi:hypothetical protein
MSEYTEQGYKSRRDYLDSLVDAYGLPRETVYSLAAMLGQSEVFDGLIIALDDAAEEQDREEFWSLTIDREETTK